MKKIETLRMLAILHKRKCFSYMEDFHAHFSTEILLQAFVEEGSIDACNSIMEMLLCTLDEEGLTPLRDILDYLQEKAPLPGSLEHIAQEHWQWNRWHQKVHLLLYMIAVWDPEFKDSLFQSVIGGVGCGSSWRVPCIRTIAMDNSSESTEVLTHLLEHENPYFREAAIAGLGTGDRLLSKEVIQKLILMARFHNGRKETILACIKTLRTQLRVTEEIGALLLHLLKRPDPDILSVAKAMLLSSDLPKSLQTEVLLLLKNASDDLAVSLLEVINAHWVYDYEVRKQLMRYLVLDLSPMVRSQLSILLFATQSREETSLLDLCLKQLGEETDPRMHAAMIPVLARELHPERDLEFLKAYLGHSDPEVRETAMTALEGVYHVPSMLHTLLEGLI